MTIFRVVYFAVIIAIFFLFKDRMGIDLVAAGVYSGIVISAIFLIDFLAGGVRNFRVLSSAVFACLFMILGYIVSISLDTIFADDAFRLLFMFLMIYIGVRFGYRNYRFIENLINKINIKTAKTVQQQNYKVLDTSALIDGRIADIVETNILEGIIVVPVFVLKELQNIADSHDHLRRQKGRRGLNILKRLQEQTSTIIEVSNLLVEGNATVDEKLITLSKELNATIVTTDYNLMKVAEIQRIKSININNLSIAMRQSVLPGEELTIAVTKEGKDSTQGVGYLDDGTMVVLESGKKHIGTTIRVEVTSLLQTDSGRIIFTKVKN